MDKGIGKNGYAPARFLLGLWNLSGYVQPGDKHLAVGYIEASAAQDLPEAVYLLGSLTAKGVGVDKDVDRAVTLFKKAAVLGFPVGEHFLTSEGLKAFYARKGSTARNSLGTERQRVLDIQKNLTILGDGPGPIDGLMGNRTSAAIKSFERDHGMSVVGEASPQLLEALKREVLCR
jgi:TPR repeat protein